MAVLQAPYKEERERAVLPVLLLLQYYQYYSTTSITVLQVLPVLQARYKEEKGRTSYYLCPLPHPSVTRQYAPWTAAHQAVVLFTVSLFHISNMAE